MDDQEPIELDTPSLADPIMSPSGPDMDSSPSVPPSAAPSTIAPSAAPSTIAPSAPPSASPSVAAPVPVTPKGASFSVPAGKALSIGCPPCPCPMTCTKVTPVEKIPDKPVALFNVPAGFQALLKHITYELLNAKPKDPYLYVSQYLREKMHDRRRGLLETDYFHHDSLHVDIRAPMHYLHETSLHNMVPSASAFEAMVENAGTTLHATTKGMNERQEVAEMRRDHQRTDKRRDHERGETRRDQERTETRRDQERAKPAGSHHKSDQGWSERGFEQRVKADRDEYEKGCSMRVQSGGCGRRERNLPTD